MLVICQPDIWCMRYTNNLFAVPFDLGQARSYRRTGPNDRRCFSKSSSTRPICRLRFGNTGLYSGKSGALHCLRSTLVWVDRKGKEEPISATPNDLPGAQNIPDGTKVALSIVSATGSNYDIWIWDLVRETMTRLTFNEASSISSLDARRQAHRFSCRAQSQRLISTGRRPTARERRRNLVRSSGCGMFHIHGPAMEKPSPDGQHSIARATSSSRLCRLKEIASERHCSRENMMR